MISQGIRNLSTQASRLFQRWSVRIAIAVLLVAQAVPLGISTSNAQSGYTSRGYRYDSKTCSAGFLSCMSTHLKMGWQNAASSSYCSQACGVFPPQADRQAPW